MSEQYDVIVIGAGPAGYVSAIRSAHLGLRTAIVDRQWLGGVCLNVGCIPSKALLKNAEIAHALRERGKEFGFTVEKLNLDYAQAVKRSRQVSDRLTRGVAFLLKKNNITVHMGSAKLTAANTISITGSDGKKNELDARNIILATGASATLPGAWKVDNEKVITYKEAILQETLPKSAIIIGAGAIGVEFSTIWNSYGTAVTLVEMLPRIVPLEDEEVSMELEKSFKKRGIIPLAGHRVKAVESISKGVKVTLEVNGKEIILEAEQALIAVGFRPNSQGIGLEEAGVKVSERGFIEIDEKMATNVPGIWAIGDVTGKLMLAHAGSAQGIVCAEAIAGLKTLPLDYEMLPRATYCQPQIASFGLTESQASARGCKVKIGRFPFQANGKALGLGDYAGWIKILTDEQNGEILGAHMIGPEVTELLPELTLAQREGLSISKVGHNIHAHPTLSEVLMEAAHAAEGKAIHL